MMAFQHLKNSVAYQPPPFTEQKQKELADIIKFGNLSAIFRCAYHSDPRPGVLLRIIHFHGNSDDIHSCLPHVDEFQEFFFRRTTVPTSSVALIVDYPGFSGHGDMSLLGTSRLDDEIEKLWTRFVADYPRGTHAKEINICWSFSIGTHYACKLSNRRADIDYLLLTAPFDHISNSANTVGAYFMSGPEWDGMNCLRRREGLRIMAYLAEKDNLLPIKYTQGVVKQKADDMKIELDRGHTWFTTVRGVQHVAQFLALAVYSYSLSSESDSTKSDVLAESSSVLSQSEEEISPSLSSGSVEGAVVPLPSVMSVHLDT